MRTRALLLTTTIHLSQGRQSKFDWVGLLHLQHMSLRLIVGPMFAGKTSEIQSIVRRYRSIGKSVLVLKPAMDKRYDGATSVVSHDKSSTDAMAVEDLGAVFEEAAFQHAYAVVVDEAQFFKGLREFVGAAIALGKHMIVVGLDGDAEGRPFTEVLDLVAIADSVEKKTALCVHCGAAAIFTRCLKERAARIEVGGPDMYEPTCRKHHTGL